MGLSVVMFIHPAATFDKLTSGAAGSGGASRARVRNLVRFIPYREAPRSGIRLQGVCNRFQCRSRWAHRILTFIERNFALFFK
jgi:hypothetical protein